MNAAPVLTKNRLPLIKQPLKLIKHILLTAVLQFSKFFGVSHHSLMNQDDVLSTSQGKQPFEKNAA